MATGRRLQELFCFEVEERFDTMQCRKSIGPEESSKNSSATTLNPSQGSQGSVQAFALSGASEFYDCFSFPEETRKEETLERGFVEEHTF